MSEKNSEYPLYKYLIEKRSNSSFTDDILTEKVNECDEVKMMNIYIIIKLYQIHHERNIFMEPYDSTHVKNNDSYVLSFKVAVLPPELKQMIYTYVTEK